MEVRDIAEKEREVFDGVVSHPLQSFEWGEVREKTGIRVIRRGGFEKGKLVSGFTLTLHRIPKTSWSIGYLPKGDMPDEKLVAELRRIGREEKCVFIQLEPNIRKDSNYELRITNYGLIPAAHPLFTRYTFVLDLSKSEEELLKGMHQKARYNIRVAQKHGVEVVEDNSEGAFTEYWRLMEETTKRQGFYAHGRRYHELVWETLGSKNQESPLRQGFAGQAGIRNQGKYGTPSAHLLLAKYQGKVLTGWMLFVFGDTLYYPYGASSGEHREVMHSSLMMWEAIRFGKRLGLKKFDMWGALGEEPDTKDSWFGFHDFKRKFGPEHVEFVGSFDLVIHPWLYQGYKIMDKLRWVYLKYRARGN